MCRLSEERKNGLIQNEHRFDVKQLAKAILQYDNVCLEDFYRMDPYRKEQVVAILSEYGVYDDEFEWQKIKREQSSENLLEKLIQYISRGKCASHKCCHLEEAKEYFWQVLRSTIHGKKGNEKAELLIRYVPLFSSWSNFQQVKEAIYKMRYYGDVFFSDDNLYIELFKFLISLPESDQKELQQEYIVQWGICAESIGRCWPCLPIHKLTKSEENDICQRRICIAADYIRAYPDSLFCNSAYSIISNDIDYLDTRCLTTEDIRRYIDNNNTNLRQMFISTFAHKLRIEEQELLSYVYIDEDWQSDFCQKIFMDNYSVIHNDCHPRTIVLNIGFWNCGKTSLVMGLSQVHMDDYNIQWENDFDKNAQSYLNKGIYPAHNTACYSIYSAHIQNKKKDTYLQFVDCNFNRFGKQFVDGEDIIDSETLNILGNEDSKIINFLISLEELDKVYNYWKKGIQFFIGQDNIINAILQSLDRYILWKRVKKINIIITKCDNYKSKKSMLPQIIANKNSGIQFDYSLIEDTLGEKYVGFFNDICDICEKWNIKSELFYFSIGTPVLYDRYKYNDNYAKVIMHSIIADIPFSNEGIITRFINIVRKR